MNSEHRRCKFYVRVVCATRLKKSNDGFPPDPYVKLKLAGKKYKTPIKSRQANPSWDQKWFEISEWPRDDIMVASVWSSKLTKNVFLGQLQFKFPSKEICETGHQKIREKLLPDAHGNGGAGASLELEIVNVAVKKAWEKANPDKAVQSSNNARSGDADLDRMSAGTRFKLWYHRDETPVNVVAYWTDNGGGIMGQVKWSVPDGGLPPPSSVPKAMSVHRLIDIFVGKPSPHARYLPEEQQSLCIGLKNKDGAEILLIAKGAEEVNYWLEGLKFVITTRGKRIVQQQEEGGKQEKQQGGKKGRRFTVQGNKNQAAAAAPAVQATYKGTVTPEVSTLLKGFDGVQYTKKAEGGLNTKELNVFFSKRGGKFGSIRWCDRDDRDENDEDVIYLHQVSQLCVGKQVIEEGKESIFKDVEIEDQLCISIVSKVRQFHFTVADTSIMRSLMLGLEHILSTNGRKVVLETDGQPEKEETGGRRFSRAFSVAVRPKTSHPGVLVMAKGGMFTRFRQKKSRPDRSVKTNVFVFHSSLVNQKGGSGDKTGAGGLFWYEKKGEGAEAKVKDRHCIPIHNISDIYCGKQQEIFNTRCANEAKDECAFSISGKEMKDGKLIDFILHLEADSEATVDAWMDGISHLLTEGGRKVQNLETGDANNAGEADAAAKKKKRMSVAPKKAAAKAGAAEEDILGGIGVFEEAEQADFLPDMAPQNPFDVDNADTEQAVTASDWDPFSDLMGAADPATAATEEKKDYDPFASIDSAAAADRASEAGSAFDSLTPELSNALPSGGGDEDEITRYVKALGLKDPAAVLAILHEEEIDWDTLKVSEPSDLDGMGLKKGVMVKLTRNISKWNGTSLDA